MFFQIKQVIIRKLREVEIHDLAELVQISSAMSLAMDDPTDLKQEVMVSQSYQSISQSSNHFLMSMLEVKSLQYLRLKAVRANVQTKFCFHSKRFLIANRF